MSQNVNIDRRQHPRNAVLCDIAVEDQAASATLLVDQRHPFFFDHPLDHVPGLLLLEGATQIARALTPTTSFVARIEASFIKYAELDRPIELRAGMSVSGRRTRVQVDVVQEGAARAALQAEVLPGTALVRSVPYPNLRPCAREPLRKHRTENVLITEPRIESEMVSADLLQPDRRCLLADSGSAIHPLHLLEAFMQTQRWLNHVEARTARMRDVLLGVAFVARAPVARGSAVSLSGRIAEEAIGGRIRSRSAFAFADGGRTAFMAIKTARLDKPKPMTKARQTRSAAQGQLVTER